MKNGKRLFFSVLLLFSMMLSLSAQKTPLIADGAKITLVASDYTFTEGPAVDQEGNVFFTDQPNDRIIKWAVSDGSVSVYMEPSGRANGLYFDRQGNLLACADEKFQLWRIDPKKNVTVLVDGFEGKNLNGPNDLWVDLKGGIYFTDPFYKRDYWERTEKEIKNERVYYLTPSMEKIKIVANDFVRPNGIVGSPDGKTLYVSDIGAKKTYSYNISEDGYLTNKQLFVDMGSDGMTLDNKGNVYLTGKGVTVFNSAGEQIQHIPIDQNWTANVTFGGKDQKTLFITAMNSLYTLQMNVHGVTHQN
ncbi:SMP-30/gluconolactonase/LRE family protein [uncultured Kriegella sp.]|uniref:SMP-30/gluconolactonase/LRE family protein n=1 Tax=uncultured Kriegella sp. TaxID=1798910 RepID=UPI0030DB7E36|tara:strand:- start:18459 stop:19370 length:912 start_codon:yes stop_codon:yes gene_type:complete